MTKEEWKVVEEKLKIPGRPVNMICDGYQLALSLERIALMKLAICVYIDNKMRGSMILEDCEERRRFFQPHARSVYSSKEKKELIKLFGKRWLKAKGTNIDAVHIQYYPWWKSFKSLKSHLIKNNTSIELAPEA